MPLYVGFDPGGTGRKLAHLTAALDDDDRLFVGRLRDSAIGLPEFQSTTFPYLEAATRDAIERCLRVALTNVLDLIGPTVPAGADPREVACRRFGAIIVSVDAPSGFATDGNGRRHTESAVAANFNTPDEATFLRRAAEWIRARNLTPLHQRVYWKLVGFAIYRFFTGAASAAEIAAAANRGIAGFGLTLRRPAGARILESFPSETYRTTSPAALALAQAFAARRLVNVPEAPLHPTTVGGFGRRLRQVVQGVPGAWSRSRGAVGDCLDSFSSLMLGPWAATIGLRACGDDRAQLASEGAIVVPW